MHSTRHNAGFTLVEVLVIAPIVILVVATIVGFMTLLTGDSLVTNQRSRLANSVQTALSSIEDDVRLSYSLLDSSTSLPSPQGPGGGSGTFNNNAQYLVLEMAATTANPQGSASRSLVYYANQPNACGLGEEHNTTLDMQIIYFVENGTLYKRTYVPDYTAGDLCAEPWQKNSCSESQVSSVSRCIVADEIIAQDVSTFTLSYYATPSSPTTSASAANATTVRTVIETSAEVAGKTATFNGAIRATKIN